MSKNAIFPGTFSPLHEGHFNIIERASKLFDNLYVCMSINEFKKSELSEKSFQEFSSKIYKLGIKNVFPIKSEGMIHEKAKKLGCKYIVRSIRNKEDADYEIGLFDIYKENDNNLEEVIFISDISIRGVSSSKLIKERKMFVFDVDGTLLNDNKEINNSTIDALNKLKRKGYIISLATGRAPFQALEVAKKININGYIIGCGGSSAYDIKNDKYFIVKNYIPINAREYLLNLARKYRRELVFSDGVENYRVYFGNNPNSDITDEKFFIGGTTRNPIYNSWDEVKDKFYNSKIIQIAFKAESNIIEKEYKNTIENLPDGVECYETSRVYLEFSPKGVNKSSGVKFLMKKYNIDQLNIYCFGDSINDLPMIKWCANSVAMGNSKEELKNIAKHVIGSNNDDSIHDFLINEGIING